ncbi:hypothetical protein JCM10207_002637 [Rhodosporidiobolus poonsookiae]
MKVVGLLSGGKDSVFNLLHCVLNGHEPVAVASLGPPEGKDELDSFMYQTVGHSGLATIAAALDLPFFSHTIQGTAVNQGGEYGSREGREKGKGKAVEGEEEAKDETEDLYELLRKVKEAMPEVEGVAAGAILSNYQRVRVEHVCSRLSLTPLAFLWERPQPALLREMIAAQMNSVLVKVAGAGLQVEHLGRSLAEMEPTLHRLNRRYELHVCGEGGEYETFTLDCPLFKRPVVLDKTTTVVSDPNPFSTVAHLHLDSVSLGPPKPSVPAHETFAELQARVRDEVGLEAPMVLEERAGEWCEAGREVERRVGGGAGQSEGEQREEVEKSDEERPRPSVRSTPDGWTYFAEVVAPEDQTGGEIEDEVRGCFAALETLLAANSTSLLSLTHLTVLLSPASSMALFPRINAIYSSYFGTSPPTRACVAVSGGEGGGRSWRVKLEGVARAEQDGKRRKEERRALHVQSLSYWAAANIGPYSQAVKTASRLYIAGQIPLIPATLTLPPSPPSSSSSLPASSEDAASFSYHASLSLQHLRRIVDSAAPSWASPSPSSSSSSPGRAEGAICWLSPSSPSTFRARTATAAAIWCASEAEYLALQDAPADEEKPAPFLAVEAGALPKGAEVEWQVTWGVPGADGGAEEDGDEDGEAEGEAKETWAAQSTVSNDTGATVSWQCSQAFPSSSSSAPAHSVFAVLGCDLGESRPHPLPGLDGKQLHSIRAFYRPSRATVSQVRALTVRLFSLFALPDADQPALAFVPADKVATVLGGAVEEHDVGFVVVAAPA